MGSRLYVLTAGPVVAPVGFPAPAGTLPVDRLACTGSAADRGYVMRLKHRPFLIWVVLSTPLLLVLSLSLYSRTYTGWTSQDVFKIDVVHTAAGVPHWLTINDLRIEGTPPPIDPRYLPDADLYRPGFHIQPLRLLASVLICTLAAVVIAAAASHARKPAMTWPYLLPLVFAFIPGTMPATGPPQIPAVLVLAFLPIALFLASAMGRSYLCSSLAGVASVVLFWASVRVADLFAAEPGVHGMPDQSDLDGFMFAVPIVLIIGVVGTFVGRVAMRNKPHHPTPQLSGDASA